MAKHTPTEGPWKVRRWSMDRDTKESSGSIYAEPRPGHAYAVAMCPRYQKEDQWNADAAFIVKACNAHEALVAENARLRKALAFYADSTRYQGANNRLSGPPDDYQPLDCPYRWNIDRDCGGIAQRALTLTSADRATVGGEK